MKLAFKLSFFLLALLFFSSLMTVMVAGNTVPVTHVDRETRAITLAIIVPQCASIPTTNIIMGSGSISGTAGDDWIFGSASADSISGGVGNDCLIGGDGNDTLNGGIGSDVLLGGPGSDNLDGGPGSNDSCYSGQTNSNCEYIYP
jgi:hypothetical protein